MMIVVIVIMIIIIANNIISLVSIGNAKKHVKRALEIIEELEEKLNEKSL